MTDPIEVNEENEDAVAAMVELLSKTSDAELMGND